MGRSQELSEFQRGTVIGCHLCNKSSRDISSLLNIPQSTVSCIIKKWKCLGTTATQPRSGRPRKLTEQGQRMLKRTVRTGRQLSAESIATDLQTSCGLQISSRTVRRELHGMGLHGRTASSKPNITTCNAKRRMLSDESQGRSMPDPQEDQAEAAEQWGKHWLHGGFYVPTVTKILEINIDKVVAGRTGVKFFVPFCGKTVDMKWLAELGHSVVGVETSENAVKQFFVESNMSYTEEIVPKIPGAKVFRNTEKTVSLYQCDLYSFTSSFEGQFDAMWDRGALVVIDPNDREKYAALIVSLMAPGCRYLLGAVLYDPERYSGPPCVVTDEQVHSLFGSDCHIESLQEEDALTEDWADSGSNSLTEKVHLLVHKG